MADYKYVLRVKGKKVWEGLNPREKFEELCKKYPTEIIEIVWVPMKGDVLIAQVRL